MVAVEVGDVAGGVTVALSPDETVVRIRVTGIASVHRKTDTPGAPSGRGVRAIHGWIAKGLTRYYNRWSAGAWFQSRGSQSPKEGIRHRSGEKILRWSDVFKDSEQRLDPRIAAFMASSRYQEATSPESMKKLRANALAKVRRFGDYARRDLLRYQRDERSGAEFELTGAASLRGSRSRDLSAPA